MVTRRERERERVLVRPLDTDGAHQSVKRERHRSDIGDARWLREIIRGFINGAVEAMNCMRPSAASLGEEQSWRLRSR